MSKIPTAKEFVMRGHLWVEDDKDVNDLTKSHIEFAKLHVKQALKEALDSIPCLGSSTDIPSYEEVEEAVLNAYPLENIK